MSESESHALPDVPLGSDMSNVEVVNATPSNVGQVARNLRLVVCVVEDFVEKFGDTLLFRCGGRANIRESERSAKPRYLCKHDNHPDPVLLFLFRELLIYDNVLVIVIGDKGYTLIP